MKKIGIMSLVCFIILLAGCDSSSYGKNNSEMQFLNASEINIISTENGDSYLIKNNIDKQNFIKMISNSEYQKEKLDIRDPDYYIEVNYKGSIKKLTFWASKKPIFKSAEEKNGYYSINNQDYIKVSHLFKARK
ncbi:hypothetical protein [Metabacillus sp. FJAT-52054]|uniref:YhfM-like domain-containing protein n=1 Tax=Metabacillus sediminis TaxID=3117746 RepID=A0ABZ2NH50_9BACI